MHSAAVALSHLCALRRSLSSLLSLNSCLISSPPWSGPMASALGTAVTISAVPPRFVQAVNGLSSIKSVSIYSKRTSFPSIRLQPPPLRFRVSCAARKETLDKVCEMVKEQMAFPGDFIVTGNSKFSELGANSLDKFEIMMSFEDAFGVSVPDESAHSILTVQDAADMIEELLSKS